MSIHPLAYVHPEAILESGVTVGPFSFIDRDVVIGEGTTIASNVNILPGTRIGKQCNIFSAAVIGGIPQDLKFRGEETLAIIGDNTTIRECVTVNRGTISRGKTVVGNACLLMAYTHVAHDCILGNNVILANATQLAGEVEIDDFAILGGGTLVHQFSKIGAHAMIQGGTKIPKDVPPYSTAAREPVSYVGVNSVGLLRRGYSKEQIHLIQDVYRIIFQSKLNTTNAIERVLSEIPDTTERNVILDFIRNSERGIIKGKI